MDEDPNFDLNSLQFGAVRRNLEYDYLALSYQMTHLLESRSREKATLVEIACWADSLSVAQRRGYRGAEAQRLHELTEVVLAEAESMVRLGIQTSPFRESFRILQRQLADLGRQLGYW